MQVYEGWAAVRERSLAYHAISDGVPLLEVPMKRLGGR